MTGENNVKRTRRSALAILGHGLGAVCVGAWTGCRGPSHELRGTLIKNAFVVNADGVKRADVRVRGERVMEMASGLSPRATDHDVIDATGLHLLPGGFDPHVHLTGAWVDDFENGSKAALAGGITTLGNMSFAEDKQTIEQTLDAHAKSIERRAMCDIVLHPVIQRPLPDVDRQLQAILDRGQKSIKVFMLNEHFADDYDRYLALLRRARDHGILTMIHCEDYETTLRAKRELSAAGRTSLRYFPDSHPVITEVIAVERAIRMCEESGAPIYIVHLSSQRALRLCEKAQSRGLPVYVETRPLYLHFTREQYDRPDGELLVGQPPLRESGDLDALWHGLATGSIQTVASDHAAWTKQQKQDPRLNVNLVRAGVNNLQVMLPMLYSEGVRKDRLTLEQFVSVTSASAAKLFGLFPRKGTIRVGSDADLVLWDFNASRRVDGRQGFSKAGFSVYDGWQVQGWPTLTMRRGSVVFQHGQITARPGSGQLLTRR